MDFDLRVLIASTCYLVLLGDGMIIYAVYNGYWFLWFSILPAAGFTCMIFFKAAEDW